MSLMWALENRGAAAPAGGGVASPQLQQEQGGVGGGGGETEWGKNKPPLAPTEAQKRWLMAGRWALGKELDSEEQEGEEMQGVAVRSASERTATSAVEAPTPPGTSEQPGMKRRVSKQFWRNLTT